MTVVVEAVGDFGPAVIDSGCDEVQLIASHRAVLGDPESSCHGMNGEALGISMSVRVDAGERVFDVDEGVVVGDAAVRMDAMNLPVGAGEILCVARAATIADGEIKVPIGIEDDATSIVVACGDVGVVGRFEDDLLARPGVFNDVTSNEAGHRPLSPLAFVNAIELVAVSKVDPAIPGVLGINGDVHQISLSRVDDLGCAGNGISDHLIVSHHPQVARSFGDESGAIVGKVDRPGYLEAAREDVDLDVEMILGLKFRGDRWRRDAHFFLAPFEERDDRPDLIFRNRTFEGGHTQMRDAVLDVSADVAAAGPELPDAVDKALGFSTLEPHTVALGADLAIQGLTHCGVGILRVGGQREERCNDKGECAKRHQSVIPLMGFQ